MAGRATLPTKAMKYTIQNGSAHFYICAVDGGYLAKSIGDSEDALRVTKGLVAKLNQYEKMKDALESIDAYWEAGNFSRDLWAKIKSALNPKP